jgi:signal peptidase I
MMPTPEDQRGAAGVEREGSAAAQASGSSSHSSRPGAGEIRRQLSLLLAILFAAITLRTVVVGNFYVPSESMLPTLLIGDHMLVNKLAFGARIPFSDRRLPALREPKRGDVVIFVLGQTESGEICPVDRCPDFPREGFVKRIIGVPGDTIEIQGGGILLNATPLRSRPAGETVLDDAGEELPVSFEYLGETPHRVIEDPERRGMDQVRITIPEGRYFMLGDNRDSSNDSRNWGTVRRSEIVGPVTMLYWSWNNRGSWWSMLNPATWWRLLTTETRWHRLGTRIDSVEGGAATGSGPGVGPEGSGPC